MKEGLHPQWYPEAQVACACGNTWTLGSTLSGYRTDICAKCHPFFTGEQRIVDTEGQVDRFMRRLKAREEALREEADRKTSRVAPERTIAEFGLASRTEKLLHEAGLQTIGDILALLSEQGDEGLTDIKGFGLKGLADLKKSLRAEGYVLPGDEAELAAAPAATVAA